jgi:site-specific recombinase XerD
MSAASGSNALGRALRGFFTEYLPIVRGMSPHTVLGYRDAFILLLRFLSAHLGRDVVALDFADLAPEHILAFLDHLEVERKNSVTTRNTRLAAVHAFVRFAAGRQPEQLELCQRLLAVPFKRARQRVVDYLEADEMRALLDAPDQTTVDGRRDYAILLTLFNTGARVQELLDLRSRDLKLERPFQVLLRGKGRKERICPLWPRTAEALRVLVHESGGDLDGAGPLFRNHRGEQLTRFGVRYLLRKYARHALSATATFKDRRIHPHMVRHTTAVHLLQAGVDLVTISHWLGHASIETTNRYATVDLETKRAAIEKADPIHDIDPSLAAWRSDATILEWLEAL